MKFDDLFDYIGEIGTYQVSLFLLLFLVSLLGIETIAINFIGAPMKHWCKVDELQHLPHEDQRNVAIPQDAEGRYQMCHRYDFNYSKYTTEEFLTWNRSVMVDETTGWKECDAWVYDQSEFVSTIQSELNLVCSKEWIISLTSTIYMSGYMIGVVLAGYMADKIGRRKTLWIAIWIKLGAGLFTAFPLGIISFCVGRFILAVGHTGGYILGFVTVMEMVGNTWRNILGVVYLSGLSLGYAVLTGFSYFIRDHVTLQLVIAIPNVIFLSYLWIIPESPRWLLVKGRYDEADLVVKYIADVNQADLPDDFNVRNIEKDMDRNREGSCIDLMRYRKMRIHTIILIVYWFTTSLIYYALSLNTAALAGSIFMNTFLSGAVEIPAMLLCIACMNWGVTGRKWTCGLSMVSAGIASFCVIPFTIYGIDVGATTFSLIGKAFTSMAFAGIYVFASELFPTEVRSIGLGTCSSCAHMSGMAAPFMGPVLSQVWAPLPFLVFGTVGTVSGILALFLPETLGAEMFDTLQEADAFTGKVKSGKEEDEEKRPLLGERGRKCKEACDSS